ncbi:hypothetical protein [Neptunomonas antarctica]|nr:hypothetical protein [Neptunomonas antarctica]
MGNIAEVTAQVIYTGRCPIHIGIDVRTGNPTTQDHHLTTHCIIMVTVDT